jgi:hypothetical protein
MDVNGAECGLVLLWKMESMWMLTAMISIGERFEVKLNMNSCTLYSTRHCSRRYCSTGNPEL